MRRRRLAGLWPAGGATGRGRAAAARREGALSPPRLAGRSTGPRASRAPMDQRTTTATINSAATNPGERPLLAPFYEGSSGRVTFLSVAVKIQPLRLPTTLGLSRDVPAHEHADPPERAGGGDV